jgi:hypothetical protein
LSYTTLQLIEQILKMSLEELSNNYLDQQTRIFISNFKTKFQTTKAYEDLNSFIESDLKSTDSFDRYVQLNTSEVLDFTLPDTVPYDIVTVWQKLH